MKTTLYQLHLTGRLKHMVIEVKGNQIITEWWTSKEDEEGESEEITKINEEAIEEQIKKLSTLRKERGDVSKYIEKIEEKASTDENLMPHIIEAVRNKVTIGEVCNSLRKIWGEYRPKDIL